MDFEGECSHRPVYMNSCRILGYRVEELFTKIYISQKIAY